MIKKVIKLETTKALACQNGSKWLFISHTLWLKACLMGGKHLKELHTVKISIQLSSLNARLYDFFPFYLHLKMVCDMALQYFFFYNNLKENLIKISIKTLTCAH